MLRAMCGARHPFRQATFIVTVATLAAVSPTSPPSPSWASLPRRSLGGRGGPRGYPCGGEMGSQAPIFSRFFARFFTCFKWELGVLRPCYHALRQPVGAAGRVLLHN